MNDEVTEQDLELLEQHLDGALTTEQSAALETRLAADASLNAVLDGLRAERRVRSAVFASLEPSDADVARFAQRVSVAARRQSNWARVGRFTGVAGSAAACILVGFFAGWLGRDKGSVSTNAVATLSGSSAPSRVETVFNPNPLVEVTPPAPAMPAAPGTPSVHISEMRIPDGAGHAAQWLVVARIDPGCQMKGLQVGDLFLSVDGQTVRDVRTLAELLGRRGDHALKILRDQHEVTLRGTTGQ